MRLSSGPLREELPYFIYKTLSVFSTGYALDFSVALSVLIEPEAYRGAFVIQRIGNLPRLEGFSRI